MKEAIEGKGGERAISKKKKELKVGKDGLR